MKNIFSRWFGSQKNARDNMWIFSVLTVGAGLGTLGSFVLSIEAIELAKNADAVLSCSINAVLNCAAVGNHPSAQLLGFPNSFIGLATMPVMLAIAVAGLMGAKFPKLFTKLAQLGAVFGLLFAIWMFYMSYSVIGILCPWCLTVDVGMIMIYFAITRYNVRENNLIVSGLGAKLQPYFAKDYDKAAMIGMIVIAIVMIILKFGDSLFV